MTRSCRDCGHLAHPRKRCMGFANCGCDKSPEAEAERAARAARLVR